MFVDRDESKKIIRAFSRPQHKNHEWVADDTPEYIAFITPAPEEIAAQEKEALIQSKIREMAEAELIKEGKITLTGDVK